MEVQPPQDPENGQPDPDLSPSSGTMSPNKIPTIVQSSTDKTDKNPTSVTSSDKSDHNQSVSQSPNSLDPASNVPASNGLGVFPPLLNTAGGSPKSMSLNVKTEPVGSATGNPRNKTALRPGFSLMDWIRLTKSGKDLSGTGGRILDVSPKELSLHRTRRDAWMAINGVVYNVTAYMDFHPGGFDELMKGAGKDATKMFNEVHRWVNYESMLQACVVGKLTQTPALPSLPSLSSSFSSVTKNNKINPTSDNPVFTVKPPQKVIPPIGTRTPTFNWHQTDTTLTISVYTRRPEITSENVLSQNFDDDRIQILVLVHEDQREEWVFQIAFKLFDKISTVEPPKVNVGSTSGKIEIIYQKLNGGKTQWANLGTPLSGNNNFSSISQFDGFDQVLDKYRSWTLISREPVTHDVDHYVLEPPKQTGLHFLVPCGHHIKLKIDILGMEVVRSYTPTLANLDLDSYQKAKTECDRNLHLLIKRYEDGAVTPRLKLLSIGSKILVSNHTGNFPPARLASVDRLILIAAGTGFTPMAKVIQYFNFLSAKNPGNNGNLAKKKKSVILLFFNKTQKDIIWRDQLDRLTNDNGRQQKEDFSIQIHHILSQEPDWSGQKGKISSEMLKDLLPELDAEPSRRLACICGPTQFTESAQRILRQDLKYEDKEIFLFQG